MIVGILSTAGPQQGYWLIWPRCEWSVTWTSQFQDGSVRWVCAQRYAP